ncbi:MAG: hypothetical protein ACK5LO_00040 [Leucobacter sp.]
MTMRMVKSLRAAAATISRMIMPGTAWSMSLIQVPMRSVEPP